jgi:uncharacterized delta-60 repeat protein
VSRVLVPLLVLALALFVALALPTAPAMAQEGATVDYYTIKYDENGQKLWDVTFDSKGWDEAMAVAVDSNDNVIVTGRSGSGGEFDYYTIKYDKDGHQLWSESFDSGDDDQANAVAVDLEGNVTVTGRSGSPGQFDYYTIKYDPQGNELWNRTYDSGGDDQAMAVAVDSDGNVIVTGGSQILHVYHVANETVGTGDGSKINFTLHSYPVKNGTEKIYLGGNLTINYTIDNVTGKITFHAPPGTGVNITADYDYEASNSDYCTIKYGTNGSELWNRTYDGGGKDSASGVAVDSEDNIVVTGYSSNGTNLNYCTIKYGTDGNMLPGWPVIYDSLSAGQTAHGSDQAQAIAVDKDDNIIVTGSSRDFGQETKWYLCTIKYHPNGTLFQGWATNPVTYHGNYKGEPWHTIAQDATADSEGSIIITGCYHVPAYAEYDDKGNLVGYHMAEFNCYITIKYNGADGSEVWNEPVIYDSGVYDCSHGVAVDSEDNIIVTGGSQLSPGAGGGGGLSTAAIAGIAVGATAGTGALAFFIRRGWGKGEAAPRAERRREARKAAKKSRKSKR